MNPKQKAILQPAAQRSTVGSGKQLSEILKELNARGNKKFEEIRSSMRWSLKNVIVEFELEENGYYRNKIRLAGRNISTNGMSLLHSSFFYPETPCRITIPLRAVGYADLVVRGTIRRCTHWKGIVHELGIEFDEAIDMSRVVPRNEITKGRDEYSNPELLSGSLLHVEDSKSQREQVIAHLADTRIRYSSVESVEQAKKLMQSKSFDMVLVNLDLPDGSGVDVVSWMRENDNNAPAMVLSGKSAGQTLKQVGEVEISGILPIPMDRSILLLSIADYLSSKSSRNRDAA